MEIVGRCYAWIDTGTHYSLMEAGQFIATLEKRQGLKVACPEEIVWRWGWIDSAQLDKLAKLILKNGYVQYLTEVVFNVFLTVISFSLDLRVENKIKRS